MDTAQREPVIELYGMGDDLRREPMAFVANGRGVQVHLLYPVLTIRYCDIAGAVYLRF
jgi:hypothetical protein